MTTVHCLRCGYDLSGLDHRALCPECTLPVARSHAGDLLRYADQGYLSALGIGLTILAITSGAQALLSGFSCAAGVIPPLTGANVWNSTTVVVWAVLWTALVLAEAGATLLVARGDPGQLTSSRASGLRVSLVIATALLATLQVASAVVGQARAAPPGLGAILGPCTQAVHMVFMILLVRYLMWIARRVPSEGLASSLMAVLVFALVVSGLSLVGQIVIQAVIQFGNPTGGFWRAYPWFTTPVAIMRAGVMVWGAVVFVRLSRAIVQQAAAGRAEQPPGPLPG